MSGLPRWGRGVLYVALAAGCFVAFMAAGRAVWLHRTIEGFAQTRGVVVTSTVAGGRAMIVATFEVDGTSHEANAWLGVQGEDDRSAGQVAAAHPVGSTIDVYYDPVRPERATLRRDVDVATPVVIALVLVVLSALVALRVHRGVGTSAPRSP